MKYKGHIHQLDTQFTFSNVKCGEALRSLGQDVISFREMGSMDKKSKGRGRREPKWEEQCKHSQFLIIPAHVRICPHFEVLPQHQPPPSQMAFVRAGQRKCEDSVLGQMRERSVPYGTQGGKMKEYKLQTGPVVSYSNSLAFLNQN